MLLLNVIVTLICFWIIFRVNSLFIQPTLWNRKRFKLLHLRDKLAILAMRGKIEENSKEYNTLLYLINSAIKETRKLEVVHFLRFLHAFKNDDKLQLRIDKIIENTTQQDMEYQNILHGYFGAVYGIFRTQTKLLFMFVPYLLICLNCLHILAKISYVVSKQMDILTTLKDDCEEKIEKTLAHA